MSTLEKHDQYTGPSERHIQNTVRLNEYHNSHQLEKKDRKPLIIFHFCERGARQNDSNTT